ncbi:zinc-dependent alcohol dehydrogenase family protein [Limnochorda pilosa]|uniref:zinc-dependent alcohol dehydrogenase family protein n=1 Tax=Limnochorda pilosa TaxID=1555112 RepID=UPI001E5DA86F|nr:zinc-dependent alcohol dehydrogenase family protein [Limnochorda pilosa]
MLVEPGPLAGQPLRSAERPMPEPGPGEVRVRVEVCGLCHTDLHTVEGELELPRLPVTPGHQVVGRVDAVGPGVPTGGSLARGTRVGVPWLYEACGRCDACRRGEENLCPSARFTGLHVDGGCAEYLVAPADFVVPIPDGFTPEEAAPLLCAGIIGYRSLRVAGLVPGERLGLYGFGASAHLALQVARHWECPVYVFSRSEEHRALARELGAVWAGPASERPPAVLDRSVLFAPVGDLIPQALAHLRPGGTLAVNAVHLDRIPAFPYSLLYGERTLRSVANATRRDAFEFLELAARIPIRPHVRVYPFEAAPAALDDLKAARIQGAGVLRVSPP